MNVQLVVASGSRAGLVIPVDGERFVIGRADDCHLKPRSELVSRYHCEITVKKGTVMIRDMGSKNGVFLNGQQITEPCAVKNSDKIAVGPLEFFVHIIVEVQAVKKPKIKSVSDAVARTMAIQSENQPDAQESAIADWLVADGESSGDLETRTINAAEVLAQIQAQSDQAKEREMQQEEDDSATDSKIVKKAAASSRDAASDLLKKFFKGGH
ncbi:MAG: FHA domain-containing protein [Planctomycetaceae bacterium]|jgi:pSer/pThr/pTyr-binding forkhead associated (FHA) protein|nr:FHA domain-containing protein [Planctomycetaceae bacterium]